MLVAKERKIHAWLITWKGQDQYQGQGVSKAKAEEEAYKTLDAMITDITWRILF